MAIGYGIDLSHHQIASTLHWESAFRGHVDFVIARACYGSKLRDQQCVEHVKRARAIGAKVGVYIFFRSVHSVTEQFNLLCSVADECGIGPGDIVPAIDIESDAFDASGMKIQRPVEPDWSGPAETLTNMIVQRFGDCLVYITQREFGMLGKPAWVLARPIWVAHYNARTPALPGGKPATIWQHRVAPFMPNGPSMYDAQHAELDQNFLLQPLPLIVQTEPFTDAERERIAGLVALSTKQSADAALHPDDMDTADTIPPPKEA